MRLDISLRFKWKSKYGYHNIYCIRSLHCYQEDVAQAADPKVNKLQKNHKSIEENYISSLELYVNLYTYLLPMYVIGVWIMVSSWYLVIWTFRE